MKNEKLKEKIEVLSNKLNLACDANSYFMEQIRELNLELKEVNSQKRCMKSENYTLTARNRVLNNSIETYEEFCTKQAEVFELFGMRLNCE